MTITTATTAVVLHPHAANAHGALVGGYDVAHALMWLYGAGFAGLGGFVVLKAVRGKDAARDEKKALKIHLADLEGALSACTKQLRNAEDYPLDCGLSDEQIQQQRDSAATLRRMIEEEKLKLSSI
jgi:hypothetical protein